METTETTKADKKAVAQPTKRASPKYYAVLCYNTEGPERVAAPVLTVGAPTKNELKKAIEAHVDYDVFAIFRGKQVQFAEKRTLVLN